MFRRFDTDQQDDVSGISKRLTQSQFWLDDYLKYYGGGQSVSDDAYLAAVKRGLSDFIKIVVPHKNISVTYMSEDDANNARGIAYTDGNVVCVPDLKRYSIDVVTGLVLHEASHILLSNYDFLRELVEYAKVKFPKFRENFLQFYKIEQMIKQSIRENCYTDVETILEELLSLKCHLDKDELLLQQTTKDFFEFVMAKSPSSIEHAVMFFKDLINWVEDRRIDTYIYTNAVGYRGYYDALYNVFFYTDEIGKLLQSDDIRTEDAKSYMFRIINSLHAKSDANALKKLPEILNILNRNNLRSLSSYAEVVRLSLNVFKIIFEHIVDNHRSQQSIPLPSNKSNSNQPTNSGSGNSKDDNPDNNNESDGDNPDDNSEFKYKPLADWNAEEITIKMSKDEIKKLLEQLKRQGNFLDGIVEHQKCSSSRITQINILSSDDVQYHNISNVLETVPNTKAIYIKNATDDIMESFTQCFTTPNNAMITAISSGLAKGHALYNKLVVLNDVRIDVHSRKRDGKLERRLLHEFGTVGNVRLFQRRFEEKYPNTYLRISIDASGSMSGYKICNAIECVSIIVAATRKLKNFRTTVDIRSQMNEMPMVVKIYDSARDNLLKYERVASRIYTGSGTPEGLCYEVIREEMIKENKNNNVYFLNLSDGFPCFSVYDENGHSINYSGVTGVNHTAKVVGDFKKNGIYVISYLIEENSGYRDYGINQFKEMYGDAAKVIDVKNIMAIARTMNELFLNADRTITASY